MKKNNLFKVIGAVILGYVLLSWILPLGIDLFGGKDVPETQAGIISIFMVLSEAVSGFGNVLVYILAVGGFYGILDATGVYKKAINLLVKKFKGKEKLVLIITIVVIALLSSICGLELGLFAIFPLVISVISLMGYDSLVALSATVGATIIGIYGSTLAGTTYGINNQVTGLGTYNAILAKIILFVLGLGLLIFFVLRYIKKNKIKPNMPKEVDKVINENNKKVWPLYLVVAIVSVLFILGTSAWENIFGYNWFATAHEKIMSLTIGDFAIFSKLFGGLDALGTWFTPYRFQYYTVLLMLASLILAIVYKVKFNDATEAYFKGIKDFIVPGLLAVACCSVFIFVYYYPILNTVTSWILSLSKDFNVALSGLYTLISGTFYVDYYYFTSYCLPTLISATTDTTLYSIISVLFTNMYGLIMLIAPTSVLLMVSLTITEVSYKSWIKYIWKLFVSLLVVSFIVLMIMLLI